MEDILTLYEEPYDAKRPVVCFDERPCQLLDDVMVPIPMKPGKPQKQDYHYERKGICNVLIAFEPLKGFRFIQVRQRRTKTDYAEFLKELSDRYYRDAERIRLVQDNLSTHTAGSFYETFNAETAKNLMQAFEFHSTPKKASWLNMVEIELSVLSKQCLDRRIASQEQLETEVLAWAHERNTRGDTVQWRFTVPDARKKLNRHYPIIKN